MLSTSLAKCHTSHVSQGGGFLPTIEMRTKCAAILHGHTLTFYFTVGAVHDTLPFNLF